ncbi:MAG: ribonuclease HI family protein, partial [Candidatus Latescibacterota bacterium]
MGIGGHITIDGIEVADFSESAGNGTNNQAEYLALIKGAKLALQLNVTHLHIRMDSQLIVNQMTGTWRNKDAELTRLMHEAQSIMSKFEEVTYEHIVRANNKKADTLATQGRSPTASPQEKPSTKKPVTTSDDLSETLARIGIYFSHMAPQIACARVRLVYLNNHIPFKCQRWNISAIILGTFSPIDHKCLWINFTHATPKIRSFMCLMNLNNQTAIGIHHRRVAYIIFLTVTPSNGNILC